MQKKRSKRTRIRAAKPNAGHGARKKHRGSGHRGGFGKSAGGKRSSAKKIKVTGWDTKYFGKRGFKSIIKKPSSINLQDLQERMPSFVKQGVAFFEGDTYLLDIGKAGYSKLLSKGKVVLKMKIVAEKATENAVAKVKAANGIVEVKGKE